MMKLRKAVVLLTALTVGFASGASAAEKKELAEKGRKSETAMDTIVVSATRTESSAFDVAGFATVVGTKQIEETQATTVKDFLEHVPGVEFSGGKDYREQLPSIRGLDPQYSLVKIDGARQNFNTNSGLGTSAVTLVDPDMLKAVEVVKGPGSVMHGGSGVGGVISLKTRDAADLLKPGRSVGARVKSGYQSVDNQKVYGASVYGTYGSVLDMVASYTRRDLGDFESSGDGEEEIKRDGKIESGMIKLCITPNDANCFSVSATRYEDEFTNGTGLPRTENEENRFTGNYRLNPESDWIDFKAVVQHVKRDRLYRGESFIGIRELEDEYTSNGFDIQNTMKFHTGGWLAHSLTVGVDWYRDEQEGTANGTPDAERPEGDAEDLGLIVQDEIRIFEDFTLTPALRYTDYSRKKRSGPEMEQSEERLIPKISAGWAVAGWLNVFGSYSESFRPPTLDELYYELVFMDIKMVEVENNPDLEAETGKTWEGGFGLQFNDLLFDRDALRFKMLYFKEDIEDLIRMERRYDPSDFHEIYSLYNGEGKTERHGLEAELNYAAGDFAFGVGYATYTTEDSETGEEFNEVPDKLSFRIGYDYQPADLAFVWKSRFYLNEVESNEDRDGNRTKYDAYDVHDVNLSWTPVKGALRLDLGVENIFDETYDTNQIGYNYGGAGRARNYKVAATFSF